MLPTSPVTTRLTFPAAVRGTGPPVLLRGRLRRPAGKPTGACVLCHPHPAFGGHMDVWLLPRIAEALAEAGWLVLRFDFRTAAAPGQHPAAAGRGPCDGREETADLHGALDLLARQAPELARFAVVGWSFGALVGLLHGVQDARVTDWVGIAPPTGPLPGVPLAPLPPAATLGAWPVRRTVIVGTHDQHFPPSTLAALAAHQVHLVAGADHFLFDRDDEVAALVAGALR